MPITTIGASLTPEEYEASKQDLIETTLDCLAKIHSRHSGETRSLPRPRRPRHLPSLQRSTCKGASFGTKFEGLAVSRGIPQQIAGLYLTPAAVGIIMSGWLGAMNYGVNRGERCRFAVDEEG